MGVGGHHAVRNLFIRLERVLLHPTKYFKDLITQVCLLLLLLLMVIQAHSNVLNISFSSFCLHNSGFGRFCISIIVHVFCRFKVSKVVLSRVCVCVGG